MLDDEIAAFEERRAQLENSDFGRWALFHDRALITITDSFEDTAKEAVRRFGRGPYLIRQIGAAPVVLPASAMYQPIYAKD